MPKFFYFDYHEVRCGINIANIASIRGNVVFMRGNSNTQFRYELTDTQLEDLIRVIEGIVR